MIIESDNKELEESLKRLAKLVRDAGGYIGDGLRIKAENGDLSVLSDLDAGVTNELVAVPRPALIPIDDFHLTAKDDEFVYSGEKQEYPQITVDLLKTMLEIYNLTGKLKSHRQSSTWVSLANDQETLSKLCAARSEAPAIMDNMMMLAAKNPAGFVLKSYLKTRTLAFRPTAEADAFRVLMPIIDFANHHPRARVFGNKSLHIEGRTVTLESCKPVEGSSQSYARYGVFDAYDMFLNYGYVERGALFARSIPLKIRLGDYGEIDVASKVGLIHKGKLPEGQTDLRAFMPTFLEKRHGFLKLSHLFVPGPPSPYALRRILKICLLEMGLGLDDSKMKQLLAQAETFVTEENLKFYKALKEYLDLKYPPEASYVIMSAREACKVQMDIIEFHKGRIL